LQAQPLAYARRCIGVHKEATLRLLAIFICFLACSVYSCSPSPNGVDPKVAEPVNTARGDIFCKLASLRESYRVGDQPEISARIINGTEKAIYLVGNLDGSERKARFPHIYYSVSGVEGGLSETRFGYCGTLNPLLIEDFTRVEPGTDFNPYKQIDAYRFWSAVKLMHSRFVKAGSYTFKFHYSTENGDIKDWGGSVRETPAEVNELWRKVARVNLTCALTVDVVK
jgi:hypothetical protein